jgi:AAA+ ATPase superfamily predicted ATPase
MSGGEFFGRASLINHLNSTLSQVKKHGRGQILALRGRRQVGKSTAVTRFVESIGTPYLYATAVKSAPTSAQLADVGDAALGSRSPFPSVRALFGAPPASWRDFFTKVASAAESAPVVVVLDEFPWFTEADPTLEGELQVGWDRTLERLPVLLVLIGSDITMMARLGEHDRPLFGRVRPMVVPPLTPTGCAAALPGRTAVEVFDAYLVTGGFPRLLGAFGRSTSIGDFVRESLRDELSELVVTARLGLDAEFGDAAAAYRVLSAIGASEHGRPGFNDVVSAISDPGDREAAKTATTRALSVLTAGKSLVEIDTPALAPPNSKLRRYRITDSYLRFWFRFVERNVDLISRGRSDIAIRRFDSGWTSWRGRAIEPVVRDGLNRLAATDPRLAGVERVEAWWNRDGNVEVDIVALTATSIFGVGTVKWRVNGPLTSRDVAELAKARRVVPHAATARLLAVSPTAPLEYPPDVSVFTANDLITAWQN